MPTIADLIAAVDTDDAARVAELLTADPSLATSRNADGVSAIMLSRYRNARAVTDALLATDPDLDVYEAATLGYVDRLRERLEEDPSRVQAFSPDGFTALHFAAFFGKPDAAQLLLDAGAAVDVYSRNGMTVQPLHSAASGRHHEVCRILLAAGAEVDAPQVGGYRPLHQAAQNGDLESAELFLSAGADPTLARDNGETPADTAEAAGHLDLAARLRAVVAALS